MRREGWGRTGQGRQAGTEKPWRGELESNKKAAVMKIHTYMPTRHSTFFLYIRADTPTG